MTTLVIDLEAVRRGPMLFDPFLYALEAEGSIGFVHPREGALNLSDVLREAEIFLESRQVERWQAVVISSLGGASDSLDGSLLGGGVARQLIRIQSEIVKPLKEGYSPPDHVFVIFLDAVDREPATGLPDGHACASVQWEWELDTGWTVSAAEGPAWHIRGEDIRKIDSEAAGCVSLTGERVDLGFNGLTAPCRKTVSSLCEKACSAVNALMEAKCRAIQDAGRAEDPCVGLEGARRVREAFLKKIEDLRLNKVEVFADFHPGEILRTILREHMSAAAVAGPNLTAVRVPTAHKAAGRHGTLNLVYLLFLIVHEGERFHQAATSVCFLLLEDVSTDRQSLDSVLALYRQRLNVVRGELEQKREKPLAGSFAFLGYDGCDTCETCAAPEKFGDVPWPSPDGIWNRGAWERWKADVVSYLDGCVKNADRTVEDCRSALAAQGYPERSERVDDLVKKVEELEKEVETRKGEMVTSEFVVLSHRWPEDTTEETKRFLDVFEGAPTAGSYLKQFLMNWGVMAPILILPFALSFHPGGTIKDLWDYLFFATAAVLVIGPVLIGLHVRWRTRKKLLSLFKQCHAAASTCANNIHSGCEGNLAHLKSLCRLKAAGVNLRSAQDALLAARERRSRLNYHHQTLLRHSTWVEDLRRQLRLTGSIPEANVEMPSSLSIDVNLPVFLNPVYRLSECVESARRTSSIPGPAATIRGAVVPLDDTLFAGLQNITLVPDPFFKCEDL